MAAPFTAAGIINAIQAVCPVVSRQIAGVFSRVHEQTKGNKSLALAAEFATIERFQSGLSFQAFAPLMPSIRKCVCGREYEVIAQKLREPDPDSYQCECGQELFRWNGLYSYSVRMIKDVLSKK
jgi:hypothetical protein